MFDYTKLKDADFNDLDVKVQVCKNNNRIDMVISFSGYQIVLENKLLSFKHDKQCSKYYDSFNHDKCTFDGDKVSYKDCGIRILEYLCDEVFVENEKDLALLNSCIKNKNTYLVVTTNPMEIYTCLMINCF